MTEKTPMKNKTAILCVAAKWTDKESQTQHTGIKKKVKQKKQKLEKKKERERK